VAPEALAQGCLPANKGEIMWYVYFLKLSNNAIYVGSTNDLRRRVGSHKSGQVQSTKAFTPLTLKSYVAVETEEHARELEAYFKSGSGKAVAIKRLIK
jgi:predicted GIY-YIG superfamily endonuclease